MRAKFVLGEVGTGLRRNLTMTIAVIITVAVSLGLFGGGLLVRAQVDQMKDYWYDKVEVSIFLCGKVSEAQSCTAGAITKAQKAQIKEDLESLKPVVEQVYFESQAEAYERFQQQFKGSPLAENATVDQMPESFRVKLSDPTKYAVVASAFQGRPGVEDVRDQRQALDRLFKALGGLQAMALAIAIAMLIVTMLLIANTMRVAAFSRRRETSIMRLVGASNLYIQVLQVQSHARACQPLYICDGCCCCWVHIVGEKESSPDANLRTSCSGTSGVGSTLEVVGATENARDYGSLHHRIFDNSVLLPAAACRACVIIIRKLAQHGPEAGYAVDC